VTERRGFEKIHAKMQEEHSSLDEVGLVYGSYGNIFPAYVHTQPADPCLVPNHGYHDIYLRGSYFAAHEYLWPL
jgi:hypothetical protein